MLVDAIKNTDNSIVSSDSNINKHSNKNTINIDISPIRYEKKQQMETFHVIKLSREIYNMLNSVYKSALKESDIASAVNMCELIFIDRSEVFRMRFKVDIVD